MKNTFLIPFIVFLSLMLVDGIQRTFQLIGVLDLVYHYMINAYYIVFLAVEVFFIFTMIRDLKYSRLE